MRPRRLTVLVSLNQLGKMTLVSKVKSIQVVTLVKLRNIKCDFSLLGNYVENIPLMRF